MEPYFQKKEGHIYVVDDNNSVRTSLARLLITIGYTVENFSSGADFLKSYKPISPAVILLDMAMPQMTGIQLQQSIIDLGYKTPIIFISGESHPHQIVSGLKKGALNFIFKPFQFEELLNAVSEAIDFDDQQTQREIKKTSISQELLSLTHREEKVFKLLVEGLSNKEIAIRLGTVDATIKAHKGRLMAKMHANSIQDLVKKYLMIHDAVHDELHPAHLKSNKDSP